MKKIEIVEVKTKAQEDVFIKLPWKIYKDDANWVPPLISDFRKSIRGENNTLKQSGPYTLILAYADSEPCGRLCIGINNVLNNAKNYKEGYLSLFECVNDYEVAKTIFDYASCWLKQHGMERIIGPLALPDGDDNRGLLIDNFDDPPTVINVYNPPYYRGFFENYGFYKYWDCYAYKLDLNSEMDDRYPNLVPYAMEKYGFRLDMIDIKNAQKEMMDIKEILEKAMPEDWEDFIPPTTEEIELMSKTLIPVMVPELIYIARTNDGVPIGFNIALPDYNQILKHMNGRLLPTGFLKYLYYKNKITRCRLFVLFVIPEYRKKGVTAAIYLKCRDAFKKRGYTSAEGSTIWEYNKPMQTDIERLGGEIYKTYRIYKKDL